VDFSKEEAEKGTTVERGEPENSVSLISGLDFKGAEGGGEGDVGRN